VGYVISRQEKRTRVLHVLEGDFLSGYFPDLSRFADGDRYELTFTSLEPLPPEKRELLNRDQVSSYVELPNSRFSTLMPSRVQAWTAGLTGLRRVMDELNPDVVHAHLHKPSLLAMLVSHGRPALRVVGRHHSDLLHRARLHLHVQLDRLTTHLADAVITNSAFTARTMEERERAASDKLRVVHYGLDIASFAPAPAQRLIDIRAELALRESDFAVLIPARLDAEKGHDYFLQAMSLLRRGGSPIIGLFAGRGPAEDRLRERARELGLAQNIRFLGYRDDLALIYQSADLTVLPTLSEAFGQVLIESLLYGTPVVASDVGGIPEIVEDGVSGLLVPPANADELARAIGSLVAEPRRAATMAAEGQRGVRLRFDSRLTARATEAVYAEFLARRS
jgi:glycosyltransferase involved in cell wall biosynthesis